MSQLWTCVPSCPTVNAHLPNGQFHSEKNSDLVQEELNFLCQGATDSMAYTAVVLLWAQKATASVTPEHKKISSYG